MKLWARIVTENYILFANRNRTLSLNIRGNIENVCFECSTVHPFGRLKSFVGWCLYVSGIELNNEYDESEWKKVLFEQQQLVTTSRLKHGIEPFRWCCAKIPFGRFLCKWSFSYLNIIHVWSMEERTLVRERYIRHDFTHRQKHIVSHSTTEYSHTFDSEVRV